MTRVCAACEIRDGASIPEEISYLQKMRKRIEPPSRSFANWTTAIFGELLGFAENADIRQAAVLLCVIQAIANHKLIWDAEAGVSCRNRS